ncbi:MAG: DUF1501 domain-containing protein [Bryobacterales bacterium]
MHYGNTGPENGRRGISRRGFFHSVCDGLQGAALATLLGRDLYGATNEAPVRRAYDVTPKPPHFTPKAKAVIQCFMNGGPSHLDLFDPKPILTKRAGESYLPHSLAAQLSDPAAVGGLWPSPFEFKQHGKSGLWVSSIMPHLAKQVDEIAMIRSMHTMHPNHEPALFMIHSGRTLPGRPGMGAWVVYGLGSENQNLPAYVVLDDPLGLPNNGTQGWQSGFLPPIYQGTRLRSVGSPILNLKPEVEQPAEVVRLARDLVSRLDQIHKSERPGNLQLDARIASYEMAARMQMEATDALDLAQEDPKLLEEYGVGEEPTDSYARRCIMARRLVERGVRYVQIFINGSIWDHHDGLENGLQNCCARTDKPVAALIKDLKQRGLMDSTLLVWGGEFGRLAITQGRTTNVGRDHNPKGFSVWMAGAGVKKGIAYGETDEIGFEATENPVSVTDWHATILHLLGLDYNKLTYDVKGLPEKLTSIYEPEIVQGILA